MLMAKLQFGNFKEGRTALHYAAAMCGRPGGDCDAFDLLIRSGKIILKSINSGTKSQTNALN
jgi:hypothetical protein